MTDSDQSPPETCKPAEPITRTERIQELRARVAAFRCMQLPGQPAVMHMGTIYMVDDLLREIFALESSLAAKDAALRKIISAERDALNFPHDTLDGVFAIAKSALAAGEE